MRAGGWRGDDAVVRAARYGVPGETVIAARRAVCDLALRQWLALDA